MQPNPRAAPPGPSTRSPTPWTAVPGGGGRPDLPSPPPAGRLRAASGPKAPKPPTSTFRAANRRATPGPKAPAPSRQTRRPTDQRPPKRSASPSVSMGGRASQRRVSRGTSPFTPFLARWLAPRCLPTAGAPRCLYLHWPPWRQPFRKPGIRDEPPPKARHLYPDARAKTREGDKRPHGFFGALPFPRCAGDPPLAANSAGVLCTTAPTHCHTTTFGPSDRTTRNNLS